MTPHQYHAQQTKVKAELLLRSQSRKASIAEALASTLVGFCIALAMQYVLWAAYGIRATASQTIQVTLWMTLVSVIRGYVMRRLWNSEWWKHWKVLHGLKR